MQKEKIKWMKLVLRPQTLFKSEAYVKGWVDDYGIDVLLIPERKGENWLYVNEDKFFNFGKSIVRKVKQEKNFVKEHIQNCYKTCESFVKLAKETGKMNLKRKSNQELYELFSEYFKKYRCYSYFLLVPVSIEQSLLQSIEKGIKEILEKQGKSQLCEEYLKIFTTETKPIEAKQEEISLLKIKVEIEKNKSKLTSPIKRKIDEHVKKYCWIPVYDVTHAPLSKKDFLDRLEKISNPREKLEQIEKELQERKRKTKETLQELHPNPQLCGMIEILQEYIFLRTYRTDALRKALYYIQPLVEEIAKRVNIIKEEAAYLTKEEMKSFLLEGKLPNIKTLKERAKHYLMLKTPDTYKIISNKKEIEKVIKEELKEEIETETLRGNTVYPGVVEGKVRIIKTIKDIGKLEKGEILVASMTTPDMTIGIHKVVGIITDEGGITCHAAICSRELKIPCVVATKNATKVLKEGDLVRVDATEGIVEKLGKKHES